MFRLLWLTAALFGTLLCAAEEPASGWKLRYFYDKLKTTLIFEDLECSSVNHCVAVGAISEDSGKLKPTALVTNDGGQQWTTAELKDTPYSIFFLNDSTGWMAGSKGIWQTADGGLKWSRSSKLEDIEQVLFLNETHGWAVGRGGKIYESTNGGKDWTAKAVPALPWPPNQLAFQWIAFPKPDFGFLIGSAYPFGQLRTVRPDWLDPQRAAQEKEPPATSFVATAKDGGQTWLAGKAFSTTGSIINIHNSSPEHALVVLKYPNGSEWPAAVIDVSVADSVSAPVFRVKDRIIKDALPLPGGGLLVAAIEPPGKAAILPIPGKVKILRQDSADSEPYEIPVDYRAVASNIMLATADNTHFLAATDTGMILGWTADARNK